MNTTADLSETRRVPRAGAEVLVDAQWLSAHLHDPRVRVVEVDVSRAAYDDWHIDGAVLWNIYADLKDPAYRTIGAEAFQQLVARSGIDPDTTVVLYGYAPALGLWILRLFGHRDVRILDCSRATWQAEGHPRADVESRPLPGTWALPGQDPEVRADRAAVHDAIGRSGMTLVDVRSTREYRGECFWPSGGMEPDGRAGHVPTAVHQPLDGLLNPDGSFRPPAELREVFSQVALADDSELITYCTIGGRAATAWFVLTYLLGRDRVRVYDGSWAEWGRTPGAPVAVGEQ
jgi:thiosulfate/3-mercaptopyruvate sulfurtransferase